MYIDENHKKRCEIKVDYEYIGSYKPGENMISNNKLRPIKTPYIRIKHKYCGSEFDVQASDFLNNERVYSCCCGSYENSIAHYIEVELREPLNKYWDFEKNIYNPYHIGKGVRKKVWIKCAEKDYHGSREQYCIDFKKGKRCFYCAGHKIHPKDSFAQYHIENTDENFLEKYWDVKKNKINPFELARGSDKYIYIKCQEKEYHGSYKIRAANFSYGYRCSFCHPQSEPHPLDSIGNKYSKIAKMIVYDNNKNKVDVYKISPHTHNKFYFKCSKCNLIGSKPKSLVSVVNYGYSCEYCSDGISIPEKFVSNTLKALDVGFIKELSRVNYDWCDKYRYDFYVKDLNMIIEVHGLQHYEGFLGPDLKNIINTDNKKMATAIKNGIDKYIVIDARQSTLEHLTRETVKELGEIFNFDNINFNDIWLQCQGSMVIESWNIWNEGIKSTVKIGEILNLDRQTIVKYLKRGAYLKKCDYDPKVEAKKGFFNSELTAIKVICLNNNKVFNSVKLAGKYVGLKSFSNISACCKGKRKSAGKINGEPARWMYYDDYLRIKNERS